MLSPSLKKQILELIDTVAVIRKRQLRKFFADWSVSAVDYTLGTLLHDGILVELDDEIVARRSILNSPTKNIAYYQPVLAAVDVMSILQSGKVLWVSREKFPTEITFGTTDMVVYNVAVFNDQDKAAKCAMIKAARERGLLPGIVDETQYIAVCSNLALARQVRPYSFHLFAFVNPKNGEVELLEESQLDE